MTTPPPALLTAMRLSTAERVARHVLFRMEHSQGTVLVWDGLGDLTFNGETYRGVGGFARLEGVSDSGDTQNHQVIATLNGVSFSNLTDVDTDIRGQAATVTLVWLQEDGTVLDSTTVFSGVGDFLRAKPAENDRPLSAVLAAPTAEWRAAPKGYYTYADQQRRFPGDTGFKYVKNLESATIAGWSATAAALLGVPTYRQSSVLYDTNTLEIIGCNIHGIAISTDTANPKHIIDGLSGTTRFYEQTSGAQITVDTADSSIGTGVPGYVDSSRDVRTAGGNLVVAGNDATHKLRLQGNIAAAGTSASTQIAVSGSALFLSGGSSTNGLQRVYCNRYGLRVGVNGASQIRDLVDSSAYVEEVTGDLPYVSGGLLYVGGNPCVISTTGCVISSTGGKLTRVGGTANDFLRIWT